MSELVWELLVCRACYNVLFQVCITTSGKVEECGERLVATIKDSQTTIVAEKNNQIVQFCASVDIGTSAIYIYDMCATPCLDGKKITNE